MTMPYPYKVKSNLNKARLTRSKGEKSHASASIGGSQ